MLNWLFFVNPRKRQMQERIWSKGEDSRSGRQRAGEKEKIGLPDYGGGL